ncbi:MAG TPA: VanZ family protein [Acetivibrio sp.]|nr:VanZ family protein [Clostridium sp.]HOQ01665.1 VanZ family protein [Acetivibrio clariflavus]HQA58011.1 VanZ family protein [Acetivibrio sp.]
MEMLGKSRANKVIKLIAAIGFIIYISYLAYLTLFDHSYGRGVVHRSINIVPFKTIIEFFTLSYSWHAVLVNIFGNIAAFVPMGFLLPIVFSKLSGLRRVIIAVLAATFSIEVLQYITGVGAADIDDILLNALGGLLGYLMLLFVKKGLMKLKTEL